MSLKNNSKLVCICISESLKQNKNEHKKRNKEFANDPKNTHINKKKYMLMLEKAEIPRKIKRMKKYQHCNSTVFGAWLDFKYQYICVHFTIQYIFFFILVSLNFSIYAVNATCLIVWKKLQMAQGDFVRCKLLNELTCFIALGA